MTTGPIQVIQESSGSLPRDSEPVLGDILRRARQHQGLSLRQVEQRTGVSNAHLSQIERGAIRRPDPAILMNLAELYGLNYELIAEWSGYLGAEALGVRLPWLGWRFGCLSTLILLPRVKPWSIWNTYAISEPTGHMRTSAILQLRRSYTAVVRISPCKARSRSAGIRDVKS